MRSNTRAGERDVTIGFGSERIAGTLNVPLHSFGCVIFAHGSGSSRFSPRNRFVANVLQDASIGTLLLDLLTPEEDRIDGETARFRFDIALLARRLVMAADWAHAGLGEMPFGFFGASTGAAAALVAAAARTCLIWAVVSRGGRPDLAGETLERVEAPTLLIVGERDREVLRLNEAAACSLNVEHELRIVPNATHLFEESGALDYVARLASDWFSIHFKSAKKERTSS